MNSKKGTVILRKLGGLGKIKSLKGNPREYYAKDKDRSKEGVYAGEYKEPTLPQSRHYLLPYWNDIKDQFCWAGTPEDLSLIVSKMKLRYPKGHPKEGQIIKPEDVDITDFNDPFFRHEHWSLKKSMEGGRIMLNRDLPEDEFFHLSYKGNHYVVDKTAGETAISKVVDPRYELINPKVVKAKKAKDARKDVNATKLLSSLSFERMSHIAEIMDLKTYDPTDPDPDSLFVALKDEAAENTETASKFGGKTYQDRFIELADKEVTSNEDLEIMVNISRAKKLGVLRARGNYWQFNTGNNSLSDRIEGQLNDLQLINFFRKVENQDYFIELEKQVKLKLKQ